MRRATSIGAAFAISLCAIAPRVHAQAAPVPSGAPAASSGEAPAPPPAPEVPYTGPNRALIASGAIGFLVWYVPGLFVASSSRVNSDGRLTIPLAGPWLDLADRPQCGPGNISCRTETLNQTVLVLDGIVQAWGIASIVIGAFQKEDPRPRGSALKVAPTTMGAGGYGVTVFASF